MNKYTVALVLTLIPVGVAHGSGDVWSTTTTRDPGPAYTATASWREKTTVVMTHSPSQRRMASLAHTSTTSESANPGERWRKITLPDPGPSSTAWASHYANGKDGFLYQRTASGAIVVPGMMSAAHKSIPFGTKLTFYYDGRKACAVVNDRGPYVHGREFDLGPGTAVALGFGGVQQVGWRYGCTKTFRVRVSVCRAVRLAGQTRQVRRCAKHWPTKIMRRVAR